MYIYSANTAGPGMMRQPYPYVRQPFSYLRLLNASPGIMPVDVYANGSLIAPALSYKEFTQYFQMLPGRYNIKVFPAGATGPALLDANVELPFLSINTAAVIGLTPDISIRTFFETVVPIPAGRLYLRFANLSPDGPDMDLVLSDGTVLFRDVAYGMAAGYTSIAEGTYVFYLQLSGTDRSLLYVPNIRLAAGRFYTVYAVGQTDGATPLQVLIPLDGNSYIKL